MVNFIGMALVWVVITCLNVASAFVVVTLIEIRLTERELKIWSDELNNGGDE